MNSLPIFSNHIITLCGSTRFKDSFDNANLHLTINGNIVLSVGSYLHSDNDESIRNYIIQHKEKLDKLHKRKIAMSDSIMVIDINNYVGESTKSEIQFARSFNLPIYSYTKSLKRNTNLRWMEMYE